MIIPTRRLQDRHQENRHVSDAVIDLLLTDRYSADSFGYEFDAITVYSRGFAQIPENARDMLGIRRTGAQKVRILGHPVVLPFPDEEQTRTFKDEFVGMGRDAETI